MTLPLSHKSFSTRTRSIAVVVIVAGYFCYSTFIGGPREEKASTALARGQEYFNAEQFDKALNGDGAGYTGFVKIADDYSSTDAGNLAKLYAGLSYAYLGKWSDAVKTTACLLSSVCRPVNCSSLRARRPTH